MLKKYRAGKTKYLRDEIVTKINTYVIVWIGVEGVKAIGMVLKVNTRC